MKKWLRVERGFFSEKHVNEKHKKIESRIRVPYGYTVVDNWELATQIKEKAASVGIELSAYCMPANFIQATEEEFQEEVARIKGHIDGASSH